jgi:adenylate cyclase
MADEGFKRKLTAILSADAVGYSRLMGENEDTTVQTLTTYRNVFSSLIKDHKGRVVDSPGDNILAEFVSVVSSLRCAWDVQQEIKSRNADLPENRRMNFRIGINLGDVIEEEDRIYGDGVNIAARLESIAEESGICISGTAYDQVKNKLPFRYEYQGEQVVKNIKEPIRVYKVLIEKDVDELISDKKLELPDKPSIAVLPFVNMSGDSDQEYFSDGLTEQVIMGLSKVSNLLVIARNSSFIYKGKSVKVQQVGKELGVKYVLEGSVQRASGRVRITSQLIDATTGYHLWAENYDRELTDIFALQDEITSKLISAMEVKLTLGEQARLWEGAGTTNIMAYDKLWRGMEYYYRYSEQDVAQARKFAKEAINLDKEYASAYVILGFTLFTDLFDGRSKLPLIDLEEMEKCALKALELNDSLDLAHGLLGFVYLVKRQHNKAIEEGKKAVALNPNGSEAHAMLAIILNFSGKPQKAIELMKRAFRLNPIPPPSYYLFLGVAYRTNGQYLEAIDVCKKAVIKSPDFVWPYVTTAACYSSLEQYGKAHEAVTEILRISPKNSIEFISMQSPFKQKADLENLLEPLRKAGLPEHSQKER